MAKTDRQTDKTSRWQFTAFEEQYPIVDTFSTSSNVAEFGFQQEVCPETKRIHRQGYLRTKVQVRFSALRREFPGIHFEAAKNWEALINYCKKEETRDKNSPQFVSGTGSKEKPLTMAQALMKLSSYADPYPIIESVPVADATTGKPTDFRREWNHQFDHKAMYISAVKNWISINPEIIALVTQPQYKSAFFDFWKDFQKMAIESLDFDAHPAHSITGGTDERSEEGEVVVQPPEDFNEYAFVD